MAKQPQQSEPITVVDVAEKHRFEARRGDVRLGFATYTLAPGEIVFIHTEIDPEFEGQGVGSALAKDALDQVRARGLAVRPQCPFISGWIKRHPEYLDLVVT